MADNVILNPGVGGATIRTDDVSGIQHPTSKITLGIDGVDDGFVSETNPLPIYTKLNSPQYYFDSASAIAAGASTTISTGQIGSTSKLLKVKVASSVPFKVILQKVLNGTATTIEVAFKNCEWVWVTPYPDMITLAYDATVGIDCFRVIITNLDASLPADVYATFYWDEA